jgi:hypothetical protein
MGAFLSHYSLSFLNLGVDGWLLQDLTDDLLQGVLGIGSAEARRLILEQLSR